MFRTRIPVIRMMVLVGVTLLLATAAYGFAAANTLAETGAGDGQATISGYDVTSVAYTLNATTPTNIDAVTFDIDPTAGASAPNKVKIKLVTASSTWFNCTNSSGSTWSCTITGVTSSAANELRVVAAE